ncbi:hypothetical protein [Chitinophaga sp. YIM B06452]|uniref:hypothetical protein n=1 Tax=Chitinophaga sp. YIM B06452 TaxID=3082158 RepID=UPI0031FE990E
MIKSDELIVMRAIAICFKPYLKPEEAYIYTNLGRTQFALKCSEFGVLKTSSGYFRKEDLDRLMAGEPSRFLSAADDLQLKKIRK